MKFLLFLLLLPCLTLAQDGVIPAEALGRLKKLYPDQSEDFIKLRLKNAPDLFSKWRSFPPYFYELVKRSDSVEFLNKRKGLCAGDPHLENFGYFPGPKAKALFTLNDFDDSTECSLDLDLMRMYMAHKFIAPDLRADSFIQSYQDGLDGKACPSTDYLKKLEAASQKKGKILSKKYQQILTSKNCGPDLNPLSESEQKLVSKLLNDDVAEKGCMNIPAVLNPDVKLISRISQKELLLGCSKTKTSGGSAGEERFILFIKSPAGEVEAIELKPLVNAAPDFDRPFDQERRESLYRSSVQKFMGPDYISDFFPVRLGGRSYQRRPLWAGNEAVDRADYDNLSLAEREAVMSAEVCKLGVLHSKSNSAAFKLNPNDWEGVAKNLMKMFRTDFGE